MVATTSGPANSPNPQDAGSRKAVEETPDDRRLMKALDLSDAEWSNLASFAAHQSTDVAGAIRFAINQTIGSPVHAEAHPSSEPG